MLNVLLSKRVGPNKNRKNLTSGIYFGEPRKKDNDFALNTMSYSAKEIERIIDVAFQSAMERNKRLCSVDKANVLEVSQLWREIVDKSHHLTLKLRLNTCL